MGSKTILRPAQASGLQKEVQDGTKEQVHGPRAGGLHPIIDLP